jgi:hypothetical protein
MDPISALGLASNIIQIVDFAARIISRSYEIYNSTDGQLQDHAILDDAAQNLSELYADLQRSANINTRKLDAADKQLLSLKKESEAITKELRKALDKARLKSGPQKWRSIFQALKSVWTEKEISRLATRLDSIRKQVDTALLVSLRWVNALWSTRSRLTFDQIRP